MGSGSGDEKTDGHDDDEVRVVARAVSRSGGVT